MPRNSQVTWRRDVDPNGRHGIAVTLGISQGEHEGYGRVGTMNMQFSIGRLLKLVVVVAVISWLFVYLERPVALATLCELNELASVWLLATGRRRLAGMAIVTAILMCATLFATDWRLSFERPFIHVAWSFLVAASVAELLTIVLWLVSVPPTPHTRSFEAIAVNDREPGSESSRPLERTK